MSGGSWDGLRNGPILRSRDISFWKTRNGWRDNDGKTDIIPLETVDKIMIDTANVEMVMFLKFNDELEGEQHER
jgi:hypothetical protein